jgi:sporulation protein YlmC with PRC-barrel domain
MTSPRNTERKVAVGTTSAWNAGYAPDSRWRTSGHASAWLTVITAWLALGLLLIVVNPGPVLSQVVKLVTVDVNVVAQGYRLSRLTGSSVVNEKNEKIGTIDDFVVARDRSLFAVLQVGGFLGMGAHLVAVPYESLVIEEEGRNVQLPGASKDELKKLPEIKFRG